MEDKELEMIRQKKLEQMKNAEKEEPEVAIYSTPSCPYCTMAKGYLESKKVKFAEYDVSKDRQRTMEMIKKSGQTGVPVLDIKGSIIVGFDRYAIDAALSNKSTRLGPDARKNLIFDPFSR